LSFQNAKEIAISSTMAAKTKSLCFQMLASVHFIIQELLQLSSVIFEKQIES